MVLSDKVCEVKLSYSPKIKISECPKAICSGEIYELLINSVFDRETIEHRETFIVLLLNVSGRILGFHTVSVGGVSQTTADIKIIMQAAILSNSSQIVLAHCHPSGNLQPSLQDDQLTKRVSEVCKLMDMKLLDHLIISIEGFYSYGDEGRYEL